MYLCYIDESGTPDIPGNTSHFVLAGIALPIWNWQAADGDIAHCMQRYGLAGEELHTAWLLRPYVEQTHIVGFESLNRDRRRSEVTRKRNEHMLRLQQSGRRNAYRQVRKNYKKTEAYIHLSHAERVTLVQNVADAIGNWGFARLFAECIDKLHFDPSRNQRSIAEQAFEQIISRFERYLSNISNDGPKQFGIVVHDNNQTVAHRHTELMRAFHDQGTLWTTVSHIIETPMFVDSRLTRMVQAADLCSYALRRFVENGETDLFNRVFPRADRAGSQTVGVRHFTDPTCSCHICRSHN